MGNYQIVDRCDFRPGDVIDKHYTVRKTLGEGSFGVVYLTENRGILNALKLLRLWEVPSEIRTPLIQRFEMEFHTGQIDCDNLVRSQAYGMVGGNPYIVMEYCPGGDLVPLLGKNDERTPAICHDILVGLDALHKKGKVHRDLKPENVLFKQNGKAALTDFGIAGDRTHRLTQRNIFGKPNQIFGTYAYMPPEQVNRARGGATVLPTTDIFSFGVLVYQLLTGVLPFGPLESHNELAEYQKKGKEGLWNRGALQSLRNGQQWTRLIECCLQPDFRQRCQNVQEVLKYLPMQSHIVPHVVQEAPPPVMKQLSHGFQIRILQGEEYGRTYDLTGMINQGVRLITVGRQPDNVIVIKSDYSDFISRHHCTLEQYSPGIWAIRDGQWMKGPCLWKSSSNGTYVNSTPVSANGFFLKSGDIISMGDVTARFENY